MEGVDQAEEAVEVDRPTPEVRPVLWEEVEGAQPRLAVWHAHG